MNAYSIKTGCFHLAFCREQNTRNTAAWTCEWFIVMTDGVTEARSDGPVLFGSAGVRDYVECQREFSAQELAFGLIEAASAYADGKLKDDAVVVLMEKTDRKVGAFNG